MVVKELLCPQRIRKIIGSFAFIEHRFLQRGYWGRLGHHELLLYVFLALASDQPGTMNHTRKPYGSAKTPCQSCSVP